MKNLLKAAPLMVLLVILSSCGGGSGGAADPKEIGDAALKKILAKEFDTLDSLMEQDMDMSAVKELRDWRIKEGYERWKDYKKRLEGDGGMDPKSKSGIDGEDKWKEMSYGKKMGLEMDLYKLYANEDVDKRLGEMKWAYIGKQVKLVEEGQGTATVHYMNGFQDMIEVKCKRINSLWYLTSVEVTMSKEPPKKPKDD
ncbi:MAG: hypothetical protein IPP14_13080 [Planctomycetes bacterium]|nr:hypothetical protein [Planctomycetota bacterium]